MSVWRDKGRKTAALRVSSTRVHYAGADKDPELCNLWIVEQFDSSRNQAVLAATAQSRCDLQGRGENCYLNARETRSLLSRDRYGCGFTKPLIF